MKIERVIISSTKHKNYIDFWPIISKAWKNIGVKPTLIYTSNKKTSMSEQEDVISIHIDKINPVFTAQNIRLLAPVLFPDEVCILSDIDIMPLSKNYFFETIKNIDESNFIIYRPEACPPEMLALCYNAALGKTWGEIFEVSNKKEIIELVKSWYPEDYIPFKKDWYFDQTILRDRIEKFRQKNPDRITTLNDKDTNFNRLNRDNLKEDMNKFITNETNYSDFHMPRPFYLHKRKIEKIYKKAFNEHQ